jgi:flagellar protein FlaG
MTIAVSSIRVDTAETSLRYAESMSSPRSDTARAVQVGAGSSAAVDKAAVRTGGSPPKSSEIKAEVEALRKVMRRLDTKVDVRFEEGSSRTVIKVLDAETGEVLRQFPSEEILAFRRSMEQLVGVTVDKRV